jgi:hypothetical protein
MLANTSIILKMFRVVGKCIYSVVEMIWEGSCTSVQKQFQIEQKILKASGNHLLSIGAGGSVVADLTQEVGGKVRVDDVVPEKAQP